VDATFQKNTVIRLFAGVVGKISTKRIRRDLPGLIMKPCSKLFEMKKYKVKTISTKLLPSDYFTEEDNHLCEIGIRTKPGTNWNAPGVYEGRLYFEDKDTLKTAMEDLKKIGVMPVIKCGLTRIVVYNKNIARLLYYYIKGRNIDAQGLHKSVQP